MQIKYWCLDAPTHEFPLLSLTRVNATQYCKFVTGAYDVGFVTRFGSLFGFSFYGQ